MCLLHARYTILVSLGRPSRTFRSFSRGIFFSIFFLYRRFSFFTSPPPARVCRFSETLHTGRPLLIQYTLQSYPPFSTVPMNHPRVLAAVVAICCTLPAAVRCGEPRLPALTTKSGGYVTNYDHMDINHLLNNDKLVTAYIRCFLGEGPCTAEARQAKGIILCCTMLCTTI